MDSDSARHTVTRLISDLKAGSGDAADKLWSQYFDRLVRLAKRRLGNAAKRIADEEDVAVSVLKSLCDGAANGRFDKLSTRDDLWKLLVAMTRMKSVDQIRRQTAKKRGGELVRGHSAVDVRIDEAPGGFDNFLGHDPTPDFLSAMNEQLHGLMECLPDDVHRSVARLRMDGFANEEIAAQLGISLRSVERKLKIVRDSWGLEVMREAK